MGLVSKLGTARRSVALAAPGQRRLAYVGWVGRRNMGDEAMLAAHRAALPGFRLVPAPAPRTVERLASALPWPVFGGVVLGGGTLVGWPSYRRAVAGLLSACPGLPVVTMGVGVEDPAFFERDGRLAGSIDAAERAEPRGAGKSPARRELGRWAELLGRMQRVSVRGPRSQEILADLGLSVPVAGDPALLLADEVPGPEAERRLLGINVGPSRAMWGDIDTLVSRIAAFAAGMAGRGWRLRFVPVWPDDLAVIGEVARRLGSDAEVAERFLDLDALLGSIRECRVFVGQKLHSVVLASAVHVPSVMLEYQPKCADFQRSLGRDAYLVRTDRLDAHLVADLVDDLDARYGAHRAELAASVGLLRGRLEEEAGEIAGLLDETASRTAASSAASTARS